MKSKNIIIFIGIFLGFLLWSSRKIYKYPFLQVYKHKGINVLYIMLFLMTFATIFGIVFSYRSIKNNQYIVPVQGQKGKVGLRGSSGKRATPLDNCNDELCYQKIMSHITNVYNVWRLLQGKPKIPDSTFIKNNYLKGKVKEICDSEEYKFLLKEQGAHKLGINDNPLNNSICGINKNCGAYDYIFQKWTEWILIILKYKQGEHFLNSPYSTEKEFNNMITKEDYIKNEYSKEWVFDMEQSITEILINKTNDSDVKDHHKKINELRKSKFGKFYLSPGVPSAFLVPDGSKDEKKQLLILSPFEEIKKYDAWYWGTPVSLTPHIINHCEVIPDSVDVKYKNKIKVKISNNYITLWNSKTAAQRKYKIIDSKKYDYLYEDQQLFGNKNVSFLRAREYQDKDEDDLFFKNYKPVGDVIYDGNSNVRSQKQTAYDLYPIQSRFENLDSAIQFKNTGPLMQTILVSGDVKPPIDFQLVFKSIRKEGYDKNKLALSIWKPIPPNGYVALGHVVDVSTSGLKPDTNSIYCVPQNCVTKSNKFSEIWNTKPGEDVFGTFKNRLEGIATFDKINTDIEKEEDHVSVFSNKYYSKIDKINNSPVKVMVKNAKRTFTTSDLEFREDERNYLPVITPFLNNYNTIFTKKMDSDEEPEFYTINQDSIYYTGEQKIKKEIDIHAQQKNPLSYSIMSIYE